MRKKSVYWSQIWDKIRGAWRDVGEVRCAVGMSAARCFQLCELRGAGSQGSSVAGGPADCGRGVGGTVTQQLL